MIEPTDADIGKRVQHMPFGYASVDYPQPGVLVACDEEESDVRFPDDTRVHVFLNEDLVWVAAV